jgi:hypothetical protein
LTVISIQRSRADARRCRYVIISRLETLHLTKVSTKLERQSQKRLARYRQIKISVIGRKSGRTISIPVGLVLEGEKLYFLLSASTLRALPGIH